MLTVKIVIHQEIHCAGPPATDTLGSTHNLQLDIMDDIVQARKVRMRMWNTSSERVCEVQPVDERSPAGAGAAVRYTHRGRRHSDYVGCPLPPVPARRRASEMPPLPPPVPPRTGIVCTDTDLHRLLDALTSSATEIDRCGRPDPRRRFVAARSSSFDASVSDADPSGAWFARRHQTLAAKNKESESKKGRVTFASDAKPPGEAAAVVWDRPSGSVVDAGALGSAIEVFLRRGAPEPPGPPALPARPAPPPPTWEEDAGQPGCDASICSSLKDLFV